MVDCCHLTKASPFNLPSSFYVWPPPRFNYFSVIISPFAWAGLCSPSTVPLDHPFHSYSLPTLSPGATLYFPRQNFSSSFWLPRLFFFSFTGILSRRPSFLFLLASFYSAIVNSFFYHAAPFFLSPEGFDPFFPCDLASSRRSAASIFFTPGWLSHGHSSSHLFSFLSFPLPNASCGPTPISRTSPPLPPFLLLLGFPFLDPPPPSTLDLSLRSANYAAPASFSFPLYFSEDLFKISSLDPWSTAQITPEF